MGNGKPLKGSCPNGWTESSVFLQQSRMFHRRNSMLFPLTPQMLQPILCLYLSLTLAHSLLPLSLSLLLIFSSHTHSFYSIIYLPFSAYPLTLALSLSLPSRFPLSCRFFFSHSAACLIFSNHYPHYSALVPAISPPCIYYSLSQSMSFTLGGEVSSARIQTLP